ncbi:MAG: AraC family transcriptional regulator [Myxococcales bacterium]|nr:AraC family transcriptional regulator [Myxococcales bacterium]
MLLSRPPQNPALAPFVESVWTQQAELPHRFERVLPSGRMQVFVNLADDVFSEITCDGRVQQRVRGAVFQGVRTRPVIIETVQQRDVCGVSFAVAGAWPFLRLPAHETCGKLVELSDVWGPSAGHLRQRLGEAATASERLEVLEAVLLEHLASDAPDRSLDVACRRLASGAPIRSVGDELGLSPRQLMALFRDCVGVGPKTWARLARFNAVLAEVSASTKWVDLALRHGFSDQAHLVREFGVFAGTSPTAYVPRGPDDRRHVVVPERLFSSRPASGRSSQ